ncbi:MAG: hypothetical protein EXS67_03415 [Candidatus Margulisbacteria bacterium]|nr:hypothetical protein [Candidatus Margulisiibacteriota bacterium]
MIFNHSFRKIVSLDSELIGKINHARKIDAATMVSELSYTLAKILGYTGSKEGYHREQEKIGNDTEKEHRNKTEFLYGAQNMTILTLLETLAKNPTISYPYVAIYAVPADVDNVSLLLRPYKDLDGVKHHHHHIALRVWAAGEVTITLDADKKEYTLEIGFKSGHFTPKISETMLLVEALFKKVPQDIPGFTFLLKYTNEVT